MRQTYPTVKFALYRMMRNGDARIYSYAVDTRHPKATRRVGAVCVAALPYESA